MIPQRVTNITTAVLMWLFAGVLLSAQSSQTNQLPAQPTPSSPAPVLSVASIITRTPTSDGYRDDPSTDSQLQLGQDIRLQVANLSDWINAGNSPWNLTLFLNERPLKGLHPISVNQELGYLDFRLERLDANIPVWEGLMDRQGNWEWGRVSRHLRASIGIESGVAVASKASFIMVFLPRSWFIFVIAAVVLSLWLLIALGRKSALLKSSSKGPYSLARTQMAVWTWLTVDAYLYLFALTHDPAVEIPVSLLGLLGISATTYVAAAMVDRTTPGEPPEASHGFWRDIAGGGDVSLHRLQMIGWTLVLSIAFIAEVLNNLSIPDFNPTLLGLMGLSAGTYVGFKFPENQSAKTPADAASKASSTAVGT
jgi:hypothetical protein